MKQKTMQLIFMMLAICMLCATQPISAKAVAPASDAQIEALTETLLPRDPKLDRNQSSWNIYFNVPEALKQQVEQLIPASCYVETTLLRADDTVALRQRSVNAEINADRESSYTLYRTAALQPGHYQLLLTVGDANGAIALGRQTISVGDYLVVKEIFNGRMNNCTPQTKQLDIHVTVGGAIASADALVVDLMRLDGNKETKIATGVGNYVVYPKKVAEGQGSATDSSQNIDLGIPTDLIYSFALPSGTLTVGDYCLNVSCAGRETDYGSGSDKGRFHVTEKPVIVSYTYDETLQIFTIQTECTPAGNYATAYWGGSSGRGWLTTTVNSAGVGKLDVSSVNLRTYMNFPVYNTATHGGNIEQLRIGDIVLSSKPTDSGGNVERTLTIQNALRYDDKMGGDQATVNYLLPATTTKVTLQLTGCSGAGKVSIIGYTGANGQPVATEQTISDLSKPIALENLVAEQGKEYQVNLYDANGNWLGHTSFQFTDQPVLSGKWHEGALPFTGNTLSCPLYGTLNLTAEQREKVEFRCMVNDKVVTLPVIHFTNELLKLDTTQIPDQAVIALEAVLPIANSGTTAPETYQPLQLNYPRCAYRQPEEAKLPTIAPIIPAAGATEFTVTYEGGLCPIADVTVNIYRIFSDKLQSVLKNKNIGRTNITLTSEQLGLSAGNYLLYFSMGDKVISAQRVTLGNLQYTVTFSDWDGKQLGTPQLVAPGADATAPKAPTRKDYVFTGWSGSYTKVGADTALVAQYAPSELTVTFHAMGGELAAGTEVSQAVAHGAFATVPTEPTREGYTFAGWYPTIAGTAPWDFTNDKVTSNLVLYAHWEAHNCSIGIDITVQNGTIQCENSTTHAAITEAKPGERVTVSVTPDLDYQLKDIWWAGAQSTELEEISVKNERGDFEMPAENVTLHASFEQTFSLTILVNNAQEKPCSVSVCGTNGESAQSTAYFTSDGTPGTYQVSFGGLIAGDYIIWLNMGAGYNWYAMEQEVTVSSSEQTIKLTVPTLHTASGQVRLSGNGTLPDNLWLSATTTTGKTANCHVGADGSYTLAGLTAEVWTLEAFGDGIAYEVTPSSFTIAAQNVTQNNITITRGADLNVTLTTKVENPAFRACLRLEEKQINNAWTTIRINGTTGSGTSDTVFTLTNGIKHPGTYRIAVQSLSAKNGVSLSFNTASTEFAVTEADITAGTIKKTLSYSYPVSAQTAFSGAGNFVTFDQSEVYPGGRVNLEIHYQNSSNSAQTAIFAVALPTDVIQVGTAPTMTIPSVPAHASGKLVLALRLPENLTALTVPVTLGENSFGTATAALATVTLQAPAAVDSQDQFKVYGEAAEGSAVSIKNAETGEIYATAISVGRFYAAKLMLNGQNSVKLVAEAVKGGNTLRSALCTVKVTNQPVKVLAVTYNQTAAQQNSRLGFFSFCQYMSMELMGFPLSVQTQFENEDAITAVIYHFCDQNYPATKKWNGWDATFSDWGGSGLKTITATITCNGGQTLELVVAEVTLLIDPSGVVTDQNKKPLAGATVTCQIKSGNLWTNWDAESTGQINPQVTGADGKYGWMVPDGSYRILATCPGYEPYDSLLDTQKPTNNSIIIPPPRTDVNFRMKPIPQAIIAMPVENGTVAATVNAVNAQMATPGARVSVTVTAKFGYRIAALHVLDGNGNELAINAAAVGRSLAVGFTDTKAYTFTMPGSIVRIQAVTKAPAPFKITNVTYTDKQVTVELIGEPISGGTYYVAAYSDSGRLLGITSAEAGGTIAIQTRGKATKVKAFLLNAQGTPQEVAVEYKVP